MLNCAASKEGFVLKDFRTVDPLSISPPQVYGNSAANIFVFALQADSVR